MDLAIVENTVVVVPSEGFAVAGQKDGATIPPGIQAALGRAAALIARGHAVTLLPADKQLTSFQAAELLNISRERLIGLLEQDEIRHSRDDLDWWVRADDLVNFKSRRDEETREALRELSELSQEPGRP